MSKKYEFVKGETLTLAGGAVLYRIRAVRDIPRHCVKAGDLGGYIETEDNLPHDDSSWVDSLSRVIGKDSLVDHSTVECGTVRNSVVQDSTVRNSTVRDSTVRDSTVLSGKVEDSTVRDSTVENERINRAEIIKESHYCLFGNVGSENGRLIAFRTKEGIGVSRGCFSGTLEEFEAAVNEKHGDNQYGREYRILIEFIKERASAWHGEAER